MLITCSRSRIPCCCGAVKMRYNWYGYQIRLRNQSNNQNHRYVERNDSYLGLPFMVFVSPVMSISKFDPVTKSLTFFDEILDILNILYPSPLSFVIRGPVLYQFQFLIKEVKIWQITMLISKTIGSIIEVTYLYHRCPYHIAHKTFRTNW